MNVRLLIHWRMKNNGTMNISIELDRIVSSGSIDPEKVFRIE